MYLAYLTLISGLFLSLISEYYSIVGLMAIFSAMPITIATMGIALGMAKIVSTVWLKQNWHIAPMSIKIYLSSAIVILMVITSLGCFGLLSKAHSDQNLVSGDVLAKIAVYDEKIKTSKDNIDVNRKQLKQMDESVDQVMGRSVDEKGADKAVALRRGQAKDRARLLQDIDAEQKTISSLNEERAPIAAEVRKVEAEVGPIKYIAAFFYGSTDQTILEKAVTWVIITIIIVFDPLAIILLLASQMSFQEFREREGKNGVVMDKDGTIVGLKMPKKKEPIVEGDSPRETTDVIDTKPPTVTNISMPKPDPIPLTEEKSEEGYVQNEEQKESNVWTNTITQTEYVEISEERKKEIIVTQWADRVKNKEINIHHVPVDILEAVKARI